LLSELGHCSLPWCHKAEAGDPEDDKHKRRNTGVAKSVKDIAESNTTILEQLRSPNATEVAMQRYFENLAQEQADPFGFKLARLDKSLTAGVISHREYDSIRVELLRAFL
jgi:hypothetical protein